MKFSVFKKLVSVPRNGLKPLKFMPVLSEFRALYQHRTLYRKIPRIHHILACFMPIYGGIAVRSILAFKGVILGFVNYDFMSLNHDLCIRPNIWDS